MTDKERINQIDIILKQIKEHGSSTCVNVYENNPSIGVLYYSNADIKSLKGLKKNLIAFQNLEKLNTVKTVTGQSTDNRLEIDKPRRPTLKHIDLNSII
ncbi:hypothetical protein [Clostridium sp. UBA4548]|uniref:hypothetical protein n=1 Tax=Clostridium sp. UBA4548 TaxID=1946361 RepID=UPI0025BA4F5D|nr:hypothetical protein [Clostridium sp. UBA4548]